jgi:hypothetical protein
MRSILVCLIFGLLVSCAPANSNSVLSRELKPSGKTSLNELNLAMKTGELWNIKAADGSTTYDFNFFIEDPVFVSGNGFRDDMVAKLIVKDSRLVGSVQVTDDKAGFFLGISLVEGTSIKRGSKILSAIPGVALYCNVNLTDLGYNNPSDSVYFGEFQIAEGAKYDFDKEIEKGCQVKKLSKL